MKPVNDMSIYDFFNPNQALKKAMHDVGFPMQGLRYLKDFANTAISMFEEEDLPEGYTTRLVETALFFNNRLCWYKHNVLGVILCRYIPDNNYDIKMLPETVTLEGLNGVTIETAVPYQDIVLCQDNTMDIIPVLAMFDYIMNMMQIEGTLKVQLEWLKLPAMWSVPDKDAVKEIQKILGDAAEFKPFAVVDNSMNAQFKQNDLKLPVDPQTLIEWYKNYKNWCTESYGISGNASQKKERLLVGEVASQSDYSDTVYDDRKRNRELWIKELNDRGWAKTKLVERYALRQKQELEYQVSQAQKLRGGNNNEFGQGNNNNDSE